MHGFDDIIRAAGSLIYQAVWVLVAAALLVFLWGLVRFIMNLGSEGKAEEGKNMMVWGVIALFVMFSIAGIIKVLQVAFLEGQDFDL